MRHNQIHIFFITFLYILLSACGGAVNNPKDIVLLPIKEGDAWGYIDTEGNKIISAQYAYCQPFSEGLGGVNIGGKGYEKDMPENGKWGFIDASNRIVINPKFYPPPVYASPYNWKELALALHEAYIFSEGLALVRTKDEWVYIDTTGNIKISNFNIQSGRRFSEGLAAVYIDGKWGYLDRNGNIAIKPQFLFPANFKEGFAYVMDTEMRSFCIDRNGNRVLAQYRITANFNEGHAPVKGGYRGEKFDLSENLTMGLIDTTGFVVARPEFDIVEGYGSGLAPVLVGSEKPTLLTLTDDFKTLKYSGGKWGFIDAKGKFIINPQYEYAKGFYNGYAPVKQGGFWGYMNPNGSWQYEPQFRWVGNFDKRGIAKVLLSEKHHPDAGKTAYINEKKIIWIEP